MLIHPSSGMARYTVALVIDEESRSRTASIIEEIEKIPPFDSLIKSGQIEFKAVGAEASKLGCKQGKVIKRLIECNDDYAVRLAQKVNADRVVVISDTATGGAAGSVANIGTAGWGAKLKNWTGIDPFSSVVIHELLHTWGFTDEYTYPKNDAKIYCDKDGVAGRKSSPNVVVLKDRAPYSSDASAKSIHGPEIPWFGGIKPSTKITTGSNLGTPKEGSFFSKEVVVGLFPAGVCDNSEPPIPTWKPTDQISIMETTVGEIPEAYHAHIYRAVGATLPQSNSSTVQRQGNPTNSTTGPK